MVFTDRKHAPHFLPSNALYSKESWAPKPQLFRGCETETVAQGFCLPEKRWEGTVRARGQPPSCFARGQKPSKITTMKPTRAEDWDRPRNVRRKFGPVPPSFAEHVHDGGFFNTSPVPVFVKTGPALFRRGVRDPRRVIVRAQFQVIHLIVYPVFENIPGMDAKGKKRRIRTAVVPRDSGRFSGPGNLEEIPSDPPRFPFIWKGTIMNVTVRDIAAFMDAWAPRTLAYDWDKVGLHTGRPDSAVTGVLACLTITPDAFRAANRAGANMIVAHHPLIWSPLKQLRSDDPQSRLCVEIAASGVACFVAHTNLDLAPGGVNDVLRNVWTCRNPVRCSRRNMSSR